MNKKVLAVAVSSALAVPMAAHAVKYKLSGQINRAAVYQNDGENSDIQFVDNGASGTRWRMNGSEDIGNGMKVGFNWEWQASSNSGTAAIGVDGDRAANPSVRKAEVWFSGGWGKVSLGQGDGAGNGLTEIDLSDTWMANYVVMDEMGGDMAWRTGAGAGITAGGSTTAAGAGLTYGTTYQTFDAFSRYDRVRYDSPALGPVTLSVSAGAQNKYEGAVRWSQGIGGGQISAGLFYGTHSNGGIDNTYGGSIAYLFSFGTNLLISYSQSEPNAVGATEGTNIYGKVGHKWGNNAVSLGYGITEDAPGAVGFKNSGVNIGFNHNIPKAKVDLYAGLNFATLDSSPAGTPSVDDIYTVTVGTKLKFD
jgi:predicted porin